MKKPHRLTAVLLSLILLVVAAGGLTACSSEKVMATVGKTDITVTEVEQMSRFLCMQYGMSFDDLDADTLSAVESSILSYLIEDVIIKDSLGSTDVITDDVQAEIDEQIEYVLDEANGYSTSFDEYGITEETLRAYLESSYYSEAFQNMVSEEEPVTDEEIQAYYDEHSAEFVSPASIAVSHILMGDSTHDETSRAAIEEVRQRILDGEDFATLAAEFSTDTGSASAGGDLGTITTGETVAAFEEAAFALHAGEVSEIIESDYGFHIIKANSDPTPEQQMTVEEASSEISTIILNEHFTAKLQALKKEAKVEFNTDLVDVTDTAGTPDDWSDDTISVKVEGTTTTDTESEEDETTSDAATE
jgi:parvulin-like peptidyl-prolyl isomerase